MNAATKVNLSLLCDVYGKLLTQKQYDAMRMYCDYDCSLAEIAEQTGISRQAVRDALVSAESNLNNMESILGVVKRKKQIEEAVKAALENLGDEKRLEQILLSLLGE